MTISISIKDHNMKKIPTIFKRDMTNNGKILNEYTVDAIGLALATATEKIDGMNVRVTVRNGTSVRLEKRRNPSKLEKAKGIVEPWYTDASMSAEDKHLQEALAHTDLSAVPDGEWSGEAVGPNIQGNPLKLMLTRIVFFSLGQCPTFENVPTTYDGLRDWLKHQKSKIGVDCGIEGIVWHYKDGRMAKIKTKDFK
jgi:hypothetical protein